MLPGTGPEAPTVVTAAGLAGCALVHPVANAVTMRANVQRSGRKDLFIRFHRFPALPCNKKNITMMTKFR
jgi:hypothetical protein